MDDLGERIRLIRKEKKMTQQDVATALNLARVSVTQWELNQTRPSLENLTALAQLFNVTLDYFAAADVASIPVANGRIAGPVNFDKKMKIPVFGQAVGGVDGEFEMNGNILFDVLCPPQLLAVKGAYGVVVSGESMVPRYFDGEIAYIDPTRRVKKGDFVVAQIVMDEHAPPHAFIKRFVRHNAAELVLEQFNPMKEMVFPHASVLSVHFIALAGENI